MKILSSELNKYIDKKLTKIDLVNILTSLSYEVEETTKLTNISGAMIGEVISCIKLPDSNNLKYCKIKTNNNLYDVICGGKNISANQKVVHAIPNSFVNNIKLIEKEIRGKTSQGMILSLSEMGGFDKNLIEDDEKNNIFILKNEINTIEDIDFLKGYLFKISILVDRNYANSYLELSREISSLLNVKWLKPEPKIKFVNSEKIKKINLGENATAIAVSDVELLSSKTPLYIKKVLYYSGIKVKNTFEDILAYCTLITNSVTFAVNESNDISLNNNYLNDYNIFSSNPMQNTSNKISLISFSSNSNIENSEKIKMTKPFGECLNRKISHDSIKYFLEIVIEEGIKAKYLVNPSKIEVKKKLEKIKINLDLNKITKIIGEELDYKSIFKKLDLIGIKTENDYAIVPTHRTDIKGYQDIIEEIIRFYGIQKIKPKRPLPLENPNNIKNFHKNKFELVLKKMTEFGYNEIRTYQLINYKDAIKYNIWNIEKIIKLDEKYTVDHNTIQTSLFKGLIDVHNYNYKKEYDNLKLFEISNIYYENQPKLSLGAIIDDINVEYDPNLFIKNTVVELLISQGISVNNIIFKKNTNNLIFNPYATSLVYVEDELKAIVGEVHPKILREYKYIRIDKIKSRLFYFELIL